MTGPLSRWEHASQCRRYLSCFWLVSTFGTALMWLADFWLAECPFRSTELRKPSSPDSFAARVTSAPPMRFALANLGFICEQREEGHYILVWKWFACIGQDGNQGVQCGGPSLITRLSPQNRAAILLAAAVIGRITWQQCKPQHLVLGGAKQVATISLN